MEKLLLIGLMAMTCLTGSAAARAASPPPTGRAVIEKMHNRYAGKWYRTFTFAQTTQVYRGDSLRSTQTWHEFIRFPDRFRMDFGSPDSGNCVIFRGDSAYRFHNGKLRSVAINNNEGLIFLLGGMFFYSLDETCRILSDSLHYDLGPAREDTWQGRPVFVIGKSDGNQLWIDQTNLLLVRMLKLDQKETMDARFEDWKPFNGGYSETKCQFYINGKLVQVETYYDCKAGVPLADSVFDPNHLNRSW
ncbi:MAG TPA: hypothetical protein VGR89_04130 [Puia sp.]|nr:hypothetical protein [Puia sp.]